MPTLIAQYCYDPQDRLTSSNALRRFYCDKRVASEIEGDITRCFFRHADQPLALREDPLANSLLFATDQQASVLHNVTAQGHTPRTYSPFGYHPVLGGLLNSLGFNGERPEAVTGHYLLGQGYRAYNPVLMRFNCPDSWSPFGEGGINSYAYTRNDPGNHSDPTGHMPRFLQPVAKMMRRKLATPKVKNIEPKQAPYDWKKRFTEKEVKIFKEGTTNWTLAKKTDPKGYAKLEPTEQVKLNDFKNLIHHYGMHPEKAANLVGDSDYKMLTKTQFQFRLSRKNRVTGFIREVENIREVQIVQAGGHT